jgi:hypothetical protein
VPRPDGKRSSWRRDLGTEAARRLKEILRQGSAPGRPLPVPLPPPSFEERRPSGLGLGRVWRPPVDEDQDE